MIMFLVLLQIVSLCVLSLSFLFEASMYVDNATTLPGVSNAAAVATEKTIPEVNADIFRKNTMMSFKAMTSPRHGHDSYSGMWWVRRDVSV